MTLFCELLTVLLTALGAAALLWLAAGRLLLPLAGQLRVVLPGQGAGEELEQAVKGLLWLRSAGVWQGAVVIEDRGLDPEGLEVARRLSRHAGVELRPDP